MKLQFRNRYGGFDPQTGEYVIRRPDTPRPWVNVISNGVHGMVISQAGGGYSWREHAQLSRLTRWDQDLTRDNWGKFVYLRDEQTGEFWSVTPVPAGRNLQDYECRHGQGYTVFTGRQAGIGSRLTGFVAAEDPLELWILELDNRTRRKRRISVFLYLEWCLGQAPDSAREFEKLFIETDFQPQKRCVFVRKMRWDIPDPQGRSWARPYDFVAFLGSSRRPAACDASQEAFMGRLGSLESPAAVRRGRLGNLAGRWTDGVSALQWRVGLGPGSSSVLVLVLGTGRSRPEAERLVGTYVQPTRARRELERVKRLWRDRLDGIRVRTPDAALNLLVNNWLPYQAISCRILGRSAYYQTGGAYGYRDQLQDSLAAMPLEKDIARQHIRRAAAHQFRDGTTFHWWHPLSETGMRKRNSDDLLWLPFIVAQYVKETGEASILKERIPFFDGGSATLEEHCHRAIAQVLSRPAPSGIPTMIEGDWNDGLSCIGYEKPAESIWLGEFLIVVLKEWCELLNATGRGERATLQRYRRASRRIAEAINRRGWDGRWYLRALTARGPLGSSRSRVARIFLNPQTWAILAGIVPPERLRLVLQSLDRHLYREYGPLLFTPAFDTPDASIGHLSQYAPGVRENGGLYTHAACWAIVAEVMAGRPEKAYELLCSFNPVRRSRRPDLYRAEPYVTPGNVDGPESPFFGRGGWTWYTGSAAWLYRAIVDYLLGVRPSYDGLIVDPQAPARWRRYELYRRFRGCLYHIVVQQGEKLQPRLEVDGRAVEGRVIRHQPGREHCKVLVQRRLRSQPD